MDSNSVSPLPQTAPMAEFDKTPPTPPEDTVPMDDLPPPPATVNIPEEKETDNEKEKEKEAEAHRHYCSSPWGCWNWTEYTFTVITTLILLFGTLILTVYWALYYLDGFAWKTDPEKCFNLHPVLMVAGFITFGGLALLQYRICTRCIKRMTVKIIHTLFHCMTIVCGFYGFMAVWHHKDYRWFWKKLTHYYSLHSWIGLVTMGLFGLQFIGGFIGFIVLLWCECTTNNFRASLLPIHAAFGMITFMLAICTCLTGLQEKIVMRLGEKYFEWKDEAIIVNALGISFIALAIIICYAIRSPFLKDRIPVTERV